MAKDPRVDDDITAAPDFAKPTLAHFRAIVHTACPDVVETVKWSSPFFQHRGPMCGIDKREDTRQKRLETAVAQIAEGKPQNWKYMKRFLILDS